MNTEDYTARVLFSRAWRAARGSPDLSTQNGAVVITTDGIVWLGYNGLTKGVDANPDRLRSPLKYIFTEHAERAAIYRAALEGNRLHGATMFCLWAACADCARAIVQSGIKKLVRHGWYLDQTPDRWKESVEHGDHILQAGGVKITRYDGPIDTDGKPLRFNGVEVCPW